MADPSIQICIDVAGATIELGRKASAKGLWFHAIAHYGAAGAALGIASLLIDGLLLKPKGLLQDRQLAALNLSIQAGLQTIARSIGNGHNPAPKDTAAEAAKMIAKNARSVQRGS